MTLVARFPAAVLFDRDGTLVADVPGLARPEDVQPVPGAAAALARVRAAGLGTGVVTNQPGLATRGISLAQLAVVHARIEALLGPFDVWAVCPHAPDAGCDCRKPRPGLVLDAGRRLGVAPRRLVVIGDIGADIEAAAAAGATGILVPTAVTRREEIARAAIAAPDLSRAVDIAVGLLDTGAAA